jgi:surface antigen
VAETEGSPQECRPYTSARTAVGLNRPVRGLACRRPDGRWQLVTEMPDN